MADDSTTIGLSRSELQEVAGYAVACARPALVIFEREYADDRRPRAAIDAAQAFAVGGERTKALRDSAWAAHRAAREARDAGQAAASNTARAAGHAVGAAFLHPLPRATSGQTHRRIRCSCRTSVRTLRRRRSRCRTRPDRSVPDTCVARRRERPEALPECNAWWSSCRGADANTRRIAATTRDLAMPDG